MKTNLNISHRIRRRSSRVLLLIAICSWSRIITTFAADRQFLEGHPYAGGTYWHFVSSNSLRSSPPWIPEQEKFPLRLHVEFQRAQELLSLHRGETNRLTPSGISIRRLSTHEIGERAVTEVPDRWSVVFSFYCMPHHRDCERDVVMLLDGNLADEEFKPLATNDSGTQTARATSQDASQSNLSRLPDPPKVSPLPQELPTSDLLSPDFELVRTQWIAMKESFPLDLSKEAARVKKDLLAKYKVAEPLILHEIEIGKYLPLGAVEARSEDIQRHRNHWIIVFSHGKPNKFDGMEYDTYVLLDGRTIATIVRPWAGQPVKRLDRK